MPRGTGIAKRGFGKALPRTGYAEGGDVEGFQPENLPENLTGEEGVKPENLPEYPTDGKKEPFHKYSDKDEIIHQHLKQMKESYTEEKKDNDRKEDYNDRKKDYEETKNKYIEKFKEITKPENLKKAGVGQPYLGPRKQLKKGGKVEKVMHEWKTGKLHSGSKKGPVVKSRKQAIAIALSEAKKAKK